MFVDSHLGHFAGCSSIDGGCGGGGGGGGPSIGKTVLKETHRE